jgi:hypothetical protein
MSVDRYATEKDRHGDRWTRYIGRLVIAGEGDDPGPDPYLAGTE